MALLEVSHIEKHFGTTKVLEDISFSLEEGQALAIIGSSGSGKTTLLRCLNFLETPDAGTLSVRGKVIYDAADPTTQLEGEVREKRLHFGLVFQNFNLFPQYTALENVTLALHLRDEGNKHRDAIDEQGMELLAQMGLSDRAGHYPHQLSGGQQQRVAIGRALMTRPALVLADEPTGNLDSQNSSEVLALLKETARKYEQTVIMITHNPAIAHTADRIFQVSDGVLTDLGGCRE